MIRSVWQVWAGSGGASFAKTFLDHGVALIGPGDAGPWRPDRADDRFEGPAVRRFATEMDAGDVVLLRTGTARIRAVGLVGSDYLYLDCFDDVHGRDLQHARRVRWCSLPAEYTFETNVFGGRPPRFSRVHSPDVLSYVERFLASPPVRWQTAELPPLPEEQQELSAVPDNLREIVAQVLDLVPIYQNESLFGDIPTEDELVAHLVVPLLRALGWPPELIGIQWHRVDVALFRALPRNADNCHIVLEAKRLGAGVEAALEQARGYLTQLGIARDVVVTDGVRYRMYAYDHEFEGVAYANLRRLKEPALDLFRRLGRP